MDVACVSVVICRSVDLNEAETHQQHNTAMHNRLIEKSADHQADLFIGGVMEKVPAATSFQEPKTQVK
jgi:hypothetical protein